MATQRYHHGDLRAVLLDEAERSIAHGGVEALSLRQLARDVGVSHGAGPACRAHAERVGALCSFVAREVLEDSVGVPSALKHSTIAETG